MAAAAYGSHYGRICALAVKSGAGPSPGALASAVASAVAVAAYALPLKQNIVTAIAEAVGACLWVERWRVPVASDVR